jgi:hypothetical protein
MQAMQQPQVSPEQKQYFEDVLFAENSLTRHIFRIFGHFDVDKLVPFPENIKNERFQRQQQQAAANTGNQTNSSGVVPITSGRESNSVPTSQNEPQAS